MNRLETTMLLVRRKTRWPATVDPVDGRAEAEEWLDALAAFDVELVTTVMLEHVGQFGPSLSELVERCNARAPRPPRSLMPSPATQECPTCGRSPFGPHRGVDPCRTCGRDDAPIYARMETTHG